MTVNILIDTFIRMRISQLKSLSEEELSLLLYVVNEVAPISSSVKLTPQTLLCVKNDALMWRLSQQESKLTPEGKLHFKSLMTKLNRHPMQDALDDLNPLQDRQLMLSLQDDNTSKSVFTQSEFSF